MYKGLLSAILGCLLSMNSHANAASSDSGYTLEKVVELSRHGIRPPTPGNRQKIEAATHRPWTHWLTADGELTGHGYAALINKARWQKAHYQQLGLLGAGCPDENMFYVRASPKQRTRATATALADGAFPGCGVAIHHVAGDIDPLFQTDKVKATQTDPQLQYQAVVEKAGDLNQLRTQLTPAIQALKSAVCPQGKTCEVFDTPWQVGDNNKGRSVISGLSVMANMVETLRLGWSENLPTSQLAWGKITNSKQITEILPLLTANYDLSNDVMYTAQRRASILLSTLLDAVQAPVGQSAAQQFSPRWLLFVAHDTNIAMVRTLMNFTWQLPGYSRGNIPPGGSLVMERWRDNHSGAKFLRLYFQAQSLDDLHHLQAVDKQHPLLVQEWKMAGCRQTAVGTLCPLSKSIQKLSQHIDADAVTPVKIRL